MRRYIDSFAVARGNATTDRAVQYVLGTYRSDQVHDLATSLIMDNTKVEFFRDVHAEALRRIGLSWDQVQTTMQSLGQVAAKGLRFHEPDQPLFPTPRMIRRFAGNAGTQATISGGLGLLLYTGYTMFSIWALFRNSGRGLKDGCDLRIIFVVVPVSVYNWKVVVALRVLSCIWIVLVGLPAFVTGMILIVCGLSGWWSGAERHPLRQLGGVHDNASSFVAIPYGSEKGNEKGKETEVYPLQAIGSGSRRGTGSQTVVGPEEHPLPPPKASSSSLDRMSRVLGSNHPHAGGSHVDLEAPPTVGHGEDLQGVGGSMTGKTNAQWALVLSKWEYLVLPLCLVHTITVVEVTIRINNLDMQARPMTTMGELLAFLMGVWVLVQALTQCVSTSRRRAGQRRSAGWYKERWKILCSPPNRLPAADNMDFSGKDVEAGSSFGRADTGGESHKDDDKETIMIHKTTTKSTQRVYQLRQSRSVGGSSGTMGRFKELIDDGD